MESKWLLGACLVIAAAGCLNFQPRFQSSEESEKDKDLEVPVIGDVTEVTNTNPYQVSGVGLVTGLAGTGDSPKGNWRTMLEEELRKSKVEHVKALLDSPDNCLVLVTGFINVGTDKGGPIDVEVTLPRGSKATSLRGGFLHPCRLRNYDSTKNVSPTYKGSDRLLGGDVLAYAKGHLLTGLGNPDDPVEMTRARIWGGGVSLKERPFFFLMKSNEKSARVANAVAQRLNLMFQDDAKHMARYREKLAMLDNVAQQLNHKNALEGVFHSEVAKAVNKEMIEVHVPHAYRHNAERYLRVARLTPLRDDPASQVNYRPRLQKMLQDPAETIRAALRLEALGRPSVPMLKQGLTSPFPLVRFASAEALCYLGETSGVEELKLCSLKYPSIRAYALLALANLDESASRQALAELITSPDTSLRCGAFWALRRLEDEDYRFRHTDKRDSKLGGELLHNAFWLHKVAPGSTPLIYVGLEQRAEVVLFGGDHRLQGPCGILAGPEFTVTVGEGDDRCTVSRFQPGESKLVRQCSMNVEDIVRAMAELGAQYSEIIEFLRLADDRRCLSCPLAFNVLPRLEPLESLVENSRDPSFMREQE